MEFGVVLQTNPPASRTVDLARQAETHGFGYVWTFDSHLLWQEPFVIYSAILAATRKIMVGPMVTNPATRDWTVIASLFAKGEITEEQVERLPRPRRQKTAVRLRAAIRARMERPLHRSRTSSCDPRTWPPAGDTSSAAWHIRMA